MSLIVSPLSGCVGTQDDPACFTQPGGCFVAIETPNLAIDKSLCVGSRGGWSFEAPCSLGHPFIRVLGNDLRLVPSAAHVTCTCH